VSLCSQANARSGIESSSKSAAAASTGHRPKPSEYLVGGAKPPDPFPRKMDALVEVPCPTAMSAWPSPSRSPAWSATP